MPSVNKVILVGNLTRDPDTKVLPSNTTVAEFGLAMNRKFKGGDGNDREEVCFVDCAAFGKQAEVIGEHCRKGKLLYVEGRLRMDQWEDKTGGKRSKLTVVVENFQFIGPREQQGGGEGQRDVRNERPSVGNWDKAKVPAQQPFGDEQQFSESDVPF